MRAYGTLFLAATLVAQTEFRGRLDPELQVLARNHQVSDFKLAATQPAVAREGDRVFEGSVHGARAYVVETPGGETWLYVDLNRDGSVTSNERHTLDAPADPLHAGTVDVRFPLPAGSHFRNYPVRIFVYKPQKPDTRSVGESPFAFVAGTVTIDGKLVRVQYQFDRKKHLAAPDFGWQSMDTNGDGRIDTHPQSLEHVRANDEYVVFKVGDKFVSTRSLDLARREVVLRSHAAGDYARLEMKPGTTLPDFSFNDFTGKPRNLSEFAGKYVLLDFWATWCGPCLADLPYLTEAARQMADRGFVVLGMNVDEDEAKARKMIAEKRIGWSHATYTSIRPLVERQFRIMAYPTYILIDGQRRIISAGDEQLRREKLLPYLQSAIAATK